MPKIVDQDTFRSAVDELIKEEKEATRLRDCLSQKRRKLPATKINNVAGTTFTAADGKTVTLSDLFEGRKQLLIYQFMLYNDDAEACVGCSFVMDHIPHLGHLHSRDTTFAAIAPAPIAKINTWRDRMGWEFPFYSCEGTSAGPGSAGNDAVWKDFGIAVFVKDGDDVLNTYGTAFRGVEPLLTTYALLDMTPLGRQEVGNGMFDFKHHDKYQC